MPNRIIRESCRTSQNLAQLSHGAERFFWRLMTVADDFGRFEAHPMVLLASCFPTMLYCVKLATVTTWLQELVSCRLVTTYAVNGKQYGLFITWDAYQRKRAKHAKYPPPSSDNICQQLPPIDPLIREARSEKRDIENKPPLVPLTKGASQPPRQGSILPPDFTPDAKAQELAELNGVNLTLQLARFKDHFTANGKLFKDWHAAFRNWIRRSAEMKSTR